MKQFAPRYLALGFVILGFGAALIVAAQPRKRAQETLICESNLKQIGLAMLQYQRDYDEHYPLANNWMDALAPYGRGSGANPKFDAAIEARYRCPTTGSFYIYNRNLSGINLVLADNAATPWLYEAASGQNQRNFSDSGELWPANPIHQHWAIWGNHVFSGDVKASLTDRKPTFRSFATPAPKPTKIKPPKTVKP